MQTTLRVLCLVLVVMGIRDELVCLDPATEVKRWQINLSERFGSRFGSQRPSFGAVCSPIIQDDAVYVQGGGALESEDPGLHVIARCV